MTALLSENTITVALRRMGFSGRRDDRARLPGDGEHAVERIRKWSPDAIERALAHKDGDQVRAAYHRGAHWNERVAMAQWWSDHIDTLRDGAAVIAFATAGGRF